MYYLLLFADNNGYPTYLNVTFTRALPVSFCTATLFTLNLSLWVEARNYGRAARLTFSCQLTLPWTSDYCCTVPTECS